ncbi:MAG: phage/plasmid primase, P4 family, partial [bacterium]
MTDIVNPPDDPPLLSDVGNAQRLVRLFGTEVRYCFPWKKWIIWTGKKWEKDNKGQIVQRAKQTVRSMYHEAGNIENDAERRRTATHALKSESCSRIKGIVELAMSESIIPILPEEFDCNSWILPVNNCTIDLTSGKPRPHSREDYNTKIVDINFDPDTKCPMWLAFLDQMMDHNQDLVDFLQKAVGYSLTGSTREQCIFILYGVGSNGKSTFLEVVSKVVGDFATRIPPESLLSKKSDRGVNNDIARLAGARLVASAEGEEGKNLAESLVKQITGGETITARFLHQEFFDFLPQFKLFYATNHKPNIRGSDHAIWRRIRLIPFTIKIEDKDQDKNLESKLSQELTGILNWALEGSLRWQKEGLEIPIEIMAATADYRDEMDILSEFMETCCVYGNKHTIHNKTLKMAHDLWCELYKEKPMSHIEFSR